MKMLRSEYVIRFFGQRTIGSTHYLFLEYADGGELFDRIGTCAQIMVVTMYRIWTLKVSLLFVHLLVFITHFYFFIEPDQGMEPGLAHHFFLQLIAGMVSCLYKCRNKINLGTKVHTCKWSTLMQNPRHVCNIVALCRLCTSSIL